MGDGVQWVMAARTEMSVSRMKQVCCSVWDCQPCKGSLLTRRVLATWAWKALAAPV